MNVLVLLSDRHTASFTGCYGDPVARTPAIDSLARRGARFDNAWCLSPTCVPSRAGMMSGRFPHELGTWCNSFPYAGQPPGWGHFLRESGIRLTTVGKLDLAPGADLGIADMRLPSYRASPDVTTLFRHDNPVRYPYAADYLRTGPADDLADYAVDIDVADEAARWLRDDRPPGPWVTVVNFKQLHRPWRPTGDIWDHFDRLVGLDRVDARFTESFDDLHPCHRAFANYTGGHLIRPEDARRALVGYYGAVEVLDRNVQTVLDALETTGEVDDTCVIYASDHGGNLGEHRILDHGGLYEESVRVPLIIATPGASGDAAVSTPVSGIDLYPTVAALAGLAMPDAFRGMALDGLARGESAPERHEPVLCQFHASGFPAGGFALRHGDWKYIAFPGHRSALFDLAEDPLELDDRLHPDRVTAADRRVADDLDRRLRTVLEPERVDEQCRADQRQRRRELAASGRLFDELLSRGYRADADYLVPDADVIFEPPPDAIPA